MFGSRIWTCRSLDSPAQHQADFVCHLTPHQTDKERWLRHTFTALCITFLYEFIVCILVHPELVQLAWYKKTIRNSFMHTEKIYDGPWKHLNYEPVLIKHNSAAVHSTAQCSTCILHYSLYCKGVWYFYIFCIVFWHRQAPPVEGTEWRIVEWLQTWGPLPWGPQPHSHH